MKESPANTFRLFHGAHTYCMVQLYSKQYLKGPIPSISVVHFTSQTREGFLRKNIVAVSFFFKTMLYPIFLIHIYSIN